jgi:hypothetical protein
MARKRHKTEEIIKHLQTLKIEKARGKSIEDVARSNGIHAVTL